MQEMKFRDHSHIEHFHLGIFILICLLHGKASASELCIFFGISHLILGITPCLTLRSVKR